MYESRRLVQAIVVIATAASPACAPGPLGAPASPAGAVPPILPAVTTLAAESAPGLPLDRQIRISAIYDFAVVPPYLYANERGMLRVLDVSDPAAAREIGAVEIRPPRTRMIRRGDHLYMRGFGSPVAVIDVSRPAAPRLAAELVDVVPAAGRSLHIAGDAMLVVRSDGAPQGLHLDILDLAQDPVHPSAVSSVDLGVRAAGEFGAVTEHAGRAYVLVARPLGADRRSQLVVVDMRDPRQPRVEQRVHFPPGLLYRNLEVRGELLYVTRSAGPESRQNGLSIWRMRADGDPEPLGAATAGILRFPMDILLHGHVAYLTVKGVPTFVTVDISDPRAPRIVHSHVENENWAGGLGLARDGNRLYTTGDQGAAGFFDITVPDAPRHLGRWFNGGAARQVIRAGNLTVVQSVTDLLFYDGADPAALLGRHEAVPLYWAGGAYQTHIVAGASGTRVVAAYESIPAEVIDVGDPARPVVRGRFEPRGLVHAIALTPTHAFLGYRAPAERRTPRPFDPATLSSGGGIEVIDLTDPSAPRTVSDIPLDRVVTDVALRGNRLVAAHHDGSVTIFDVGDPARATVLARLPGSDAGPPPFALATARVAISADARFAYVTHAVLPADGNPYADGTGTLTVIALVDPSRPRAVSRLQFDRRADTSVPVASHGRCVAVLMGGSGGVLVLDVADPANPTPIAREPLPAAAYADAIAMDATRLYVGAWEDGVLVYTLPSGEQGPWTDGRRLRGDRSCD
jgi:hypothetical protein